MAKPVYLSVNKTIDQPLEKVWKTVALGFGHVADYNPEIKSSRFETDQLSGIGTKRHCDFHNKGYIKEEITAWDPLTSFQLKFTTSSVPMSVLESKFSFEEKEGMTIVTQAFWYRMKAPLGWLSGLMKRKMKSTLEKGLNGLETYLNNN